MDRTLLNLRNKYGIWCTTGKYRMLINNVKFTLSLVVDVDVFFFKRLYVPTQKHTQVNGNASMKHDRKCIYANNAEYILFYDA